MAQEACSNFGGVYRKFKPHLLMVLAQVASTFLYFLTEASFNHGMNPHVYITYGHIVSGLVMFPFAYVLERKQRPKLTIALFLELFVLSLLGVGLTLNMLEVLDLRSPRGLEKVLGTLVSLAGVITMTLYKGLKFRYIPEFEKRTKEKLINNDDYLPENQSLRERRSHEAFFVGSILTVACCITWSIWYIMQAITLERYPAQLSLTTWMGFIGAAQPAVFTVCIEHRRAAWAIGFNIDLWSYYILIVGAFSVILGLYLLLWGKESDEVYINSEEHKDKNIQKITSAKTDVLHDEP
ncbi:hypothetical protein PRUPE_1G037300 [Prunus persica]|uniref:WAT1-related protein n=1 Tax=Prunus persica TaxID=3760 RepID=A0A251QS45_PRUPE|nr:hypothetical protein PRUPE_1G037300 [Prunus persica]